MMTPLLIGPDERAALAGLRALANAHPVDMPVLIEAIRHKAGKAAHRLQMNAQTIAIPLNFLATFSIETGHPVGTCRHLSLSVGVVGRVPNPHAVWLVAEALGFTGGLTSCTTWVEALTGHGQAVNVVQPVSIDGLLQSQHDGVLQ